ncbi:hypothetical protein DL769_003234 [Monosporascus sp. CRB-8-3]|nr:hypothetical protein DL769_003234 [Monosporascus sp. CRB-8-3]
MVVGFGRTIVLEMLYLRLQFLELDTTAPPDLTAIAESLLRFQVAGNCENDGAASSPLLHSVEPELYLDKGGPFYIPRFKLNKRQNDRYDSGRRNITKQIAIREMTVELVQRETQDASWYLLEGKDTPELKAAVEIDVLYSNTADYLQLFCTKLLARAAIRDVSAGTLVIALQPSSSLSRAVDRIIPDKEARVLHLAAEPGSEWDYIHPKATKAEIQNLITSKIGTVPPSPVLLLDMKAL